MSWLKEKYKNEIVLKMMKKFGYKNIMQVPKMEKIVLNVAAGEAKDDKKVIDSILNDLSQITGQRGVPCRAKRSIANFKIREGAIIGAMVTLRGKKMFDFMCRFFGVALPRVRDFRGISSNSFDGRGNYNMGIKEQLIFPEIDFEKVDKTRGMNISFITTAKTDEESKELLSLLGAPFKEA